MELLTALSSPITRTMFCDKCFEAGRPTKSMAYMTYGYDSQEYIPNVHIGNIPMENLGITPHIIFPPSFHQKADDIYCRCYVVCGIIGCGFETVHDEANGSWKILTDTRARVHYFKAQDLKALILNPPREYYLENLDQRVWDVNEVISEQMRNIRKKGRR